MHADLPDSHRRSSNRKRFKLGKMPQIETYKQLMVSKIETHKNYATMQVNEMSWANMLPAVYRMRNTTEPNASP